MEPTSGGGASWTLKRLHKLIMMSDTYQQQSVHPQEAEYAQRDFLNRNLWKFNRHRLNSEALRDTMLAVSGQLNLKMGGSSFYPKMSSEALEGLSRKAGDWKDSSTNERSRRSIYMMTKRSRLLPLMTAFDFSDTTASCGQRDVTTVTPQALALLNNHFTHNQSEALAYRLATQTVITQEQIKLAWRLAFGRNPADAEIAQAAAHLRAQQTHFEKEKNADHLALASLCHVLLNSNEFIYVD